MLIALVILVAAGATAIATFYTDLLWFKETNYLFVFTRILSARWIVGIIGAVFFFTVVYANLQAVIWKRRNLLVVGGLIMPEPIDMPRKAGFLLAGVAGVIGIMGGMAAFGQWSVVLSYLNQTPFGIADPFFGKDAAFYVFSLPFIKLLQQHLWLVLLVSLILSAGLYYILGDIRSGFRRLVVERKARVHLSILIALLFAIKAWGYQISIWDLMYSPRGAAFGASYTDIHAQVPAFKALVVIALIGAAVTLAGAFLGNLRWVGLSVAGLIILSFALGYGYPEFMQRFTVSPNELAYEVPYIESNIKFTRHAFGLDKMEPVVFSPETAIDREDIERKQITIDNLRLWDYRVAKDTYRQTQEIRMYYSFYDVDIARYLINGEYKQVLFSPRELDINLLPAEAGTWINRHLKYTHGYGFVMSPVGDVTAEGWPDFYFMDVPPRNKTDLVLTRPEIYFGELTNHYVILKTNEPEFDYPRTGETIQPTFYQGETGIPIGNIINRLAFALRFRDYPILVSGAINPDSHIVIYRNIKERVKKIAPFLIYDNDPYMVLAEGRLYWIIDAYTVSGNYPYSQPDDATGINYVRNSVKVVINAYDGTVDFYNFDKSDPIILTYSSIFPGLFKPKEEMPQSLMVHIRYPVDLFKMQSAKLLTYHMTDPYVYYNKEDYWELPVEIYGRDEIRVEPYYILTTLPGQTQAEFMLMTTFTPRGKPNMTAWLAARCNPEQYGQTILFTIPKESMVHGPMQVESIFSQNAEISQSITLWGQSGSQVIRGNLVTIPINGSLLYVEPLYIQAETVKIPELKRVIMFYAGKIAFKETVEDSLNQLFGKPGDRPPGPDDPIDKKDLDSLAEAAVRLWNKAQERIRAGDWAGYGSAIDELGSIIMEMQRLIDAGITETEIPEDLNLWSEVVQ